MGIFVRKVCSNNVSAAVRICSNSVTAAVVNVAMT